MKIMKQSVYSGLLVMLVLWGQVDMLLAQARHTDPNGASYITTKSVFVPRQAPAIEDPETGRLIPGRLDRTRLRDEILNYLGECVVDFNDAGALALSEHSLWFDRIYIPWFQACDSWGYIDMRPLKYDHFHLGFADPDVVPCVTNDQVYPGHLQEDGTCEFVDVPTEPRTHVTTHGGTESLLFRAMGPSGEDCIPFDLNQIRVVGSAPVRFCYKPAQETDLNWEVYETDGHTSPGVWLCWDQLDPGTWDLSAWVWDVVEVKVTITPGTLGPFSIDDIQFGIL